MNNREFIKGVATEIKGSYMVLVAEDEKVNCYFPKNKLSFMPSEGTEAKLGGYFKPFSNGKTYFVIKQVIEAKASGGSNVTLRHDPNKDLPYLERVFKLLNKKIGGEGKQVRIQLIDNATGETINKVMNLWEDDLTTVRDSGGEYQGYHDYHFKQARVPGRLHNANLANKKWGSMIEGKIRVEVTQVAAHESYSGYDKPHYLNKEENEAKDSIIFIIESFIKRPNQHVKVACRWKQFYVTGLRLIIDR